MFCNKCGKDNADNAVKCKSCGAPMPAKTLRSGFGDILSYENTSPTTVRKESNAMNNMPVMPPQMPKKSSPLGVIALCLSALALLIAIMAFVMSTSKAGVDEPENTDKPPVTQETEGKDESEIEEIEATPIEKNTELAPLVDESTDPTPEIPGGGTENTKTATLQEELDNFAAEVLEDPEWSKDALTNQDKLKEFVKFHYSQFSEDEAKIAELVEIITVETTLEELDEKAEELSNE